jgi:primosomal protein N' (replication factor Y)
VNADASIHLPDFRAGEKSFQLFTQMAGRAGRGEMPGRVIIQTYDPKNPSIVHAMNHDYRSFAEGELRNRHDFSYPPYSRMARLLFTAPSSEEAEQAAERVHLALSRIKVDPPVQITGPGVAVLAKVQNRFRWNLLLRCTQARSLHTLIDSLMANSEQLLPKRVTLQVDVDPVSLM